MVWLLVVVRRLAASVAALRYSVSNMAAVVKRGAAAGGLAMD
ncbi:MAG: hypothetical protein WDN25_11400 [Acetobacteraceae bacterium]